MSDGDNATAGRHGRGESSSPDSPSETHPWLTRSAQPSPGAAPWERVHVSDDDESVAETVGNHTDGITVADLIAKLNGDHAVPTELKRHRPDVTALPPPSPTATATPHR